MLNLRSVKVRCSGHVSNFEVVETPVIEVDYNDQQEEAHRNYRYDSLPKILDVPLEVLVVNFGVYRVKDHFG